MTIIIYLFSGVFYAMAAALALLLDTWWPLVIGLLSAWSLRLMGLDPGPAVARKQDPPL